MSLTTGRGPFSRDPAGHFTKQMPADVVYVEPFQRRVRGIAGGKPVVDSERAVLVHRPGRPPSYAFPAGAVDRIRAEPDPDAPGYVTVAWESVDEWYEEDERVYGHPRNPYHRVDCVPTSRRLRVEVAGVTLVDTTDTLGVYETSLAPKLYVHPDTVRMDLLTPSSTATYCPYKGTASYWDADVGGATVEDVAWTYAEPLPECPSIRGLLGFDERRATVIHDLPAPR